MGATGKALLRQCWSQTSPIFCGVWDESVPPTSASPGPLSPPEGTRSGNADSLLVSCVLSALRGDTCSGRRGWRSPLGSMSCFHIRTAVLQSFLKNKPGLTHRAGFPQPALRHQLHHFTGDVFWNSEDTVLSLALLGHPHSLPKPSPRSTCTCTCTKSPRLPRLQLCKLHWASDQCWKCSLAMGLLGGVRDVAGTSAHI